MRHPGRLLLPIAIFIAGSCGGVRSQRHLARTYTLKSVDGAPLPENSDANAGIIFRTLWSTLELDGDSTSITITHLRRINVGADSLEYSDTAIVPYRILRGDSIVVGNRILCTPCYVPREGKLTERGLTLATNFGSHLGPVFSYTLER